MTIDPLKIPELVNWYEGMLLMPSHFQHAARRQEGLTGWLAETAAPHGWGVRRLISELSDGKFQIRELEAVMPDRLMVTYPYAADNTDLSIDLKGAFTDGQDRLYVYLAVARWSGAAFGTSGMARYRPARGERTEAYDGELLPDPDGKMRETPWLRPLLQLRTSTSLLEPLPEPLIGLPLACFVEREAAVTRSRYHPPSLAIATPVVREGRLEDRPLKEHAEAVRRELGAKAELLNARLGSSAATTTGAVKSAAKIEPTNGSGEVEAKVDNMQTLRQVLRQTTEAVVSRQQLLSDLNAVTRTLPRLNALIGDAATHPHTAFLTLCDVLGDLSVINGSYRLPDDLPTYEHRDPLKSYEAVYNQIVAILENLNQRYRAIPFERVSATRFVLKARPISTDSSFTIGVVRRPGQDLAALVSWMRNARIATEAKEATHLKLSRIPGAGREPITEDTELDLATTADRRLYRIDDVNEDIARLDRTLVIDGIGDEGPAQVLLYVRAGEAAGRTPP